MYYTYYVRPGVKVDPNTLLGEALRAIRRLAFKIISKLHFGGFAIILKLHLKPAYSARQSRRRGQSGRIRDFESAQTSIGTQSTAARPSAARRGAGGTGAAAGRAASGAAAEGRSAASLSLSLSSWEQALADAHGLVQNGDRLAC